MNFLSKTLSTLTGSSIPYTFKEKIVDPTSSVNLVDRYSIWTVYKGVRPKTDTPVTIFEFNLRDPANIQRGLEPLARNAFKKLKVIKFPGVISAIDFIDNDSYLYIITEPVVPLLSYLQDVESEKPLSQDAKLSGLYTIAQALKFINLTCTSVHGNVSLLSSIYVTESGDWKLFGFELSTNLKSDPDQPLYRNSQKSPDFRNAIPEEVAKGGAEAVRSFPIKLDSYKYGALVFQVLGTTDFSAIETTFESKNITNKNVPTKIAATLRKLVNPKMNLRASIEKYLEETEAYYDTNLLVTFGKHLEDLKFQNEEQKLEFIKFELANYINKDDEDGYFPPGFLNYKLLPELINQFNNLSKDRSNAAISQLENQQRQETLSLLLDYILKFGVKLSSAHFNKQIKPIILETFTLGDRSIRLVLLTHLPLYEAFLTESDVQSKVFYNLISGFQDTNFMIRETTLKSITIIIDKISVKQVNQDLLKVLAKSQMDPKPSIRVNTLILIIKISERIYKNSRNNVLITALSKSLRDSFTPSKLTALSGFESLIDQFSLDEICTKILGHLAISLMDKDSTKVRKEAKRIFQLFLDSVESHASTLPDVEADGESEEAEFFAKFAPSSIATGKSNEQESGAQSGSSFSFGWSMVNKLVATSGIEGQLNHDFNNSTPDLTKENTPTAETTGKPTNTLATKARVDEWSQSFSDDEVDGWGFEEPEVVHLGADSTITPPAKSVSTKSKQTKPLATRNTAQKKTSGLKLGAQSKKPISKLKLNLTVDDDGGKAWDDDW
ncbi:armadillo-type protein [Scheffersomyces xylosifermentans]|uniref:armadillo-type protein n=1 Tax=Scheffersomyces xylosifermentans TaxID=1304137 RepID=UPI00315D6295